MIITHHNRHFFFWYEAYVSETLAKRDGAGMEEMLERAEDERSHAVPEMLIELNMKSVWARCLSLYKGELEKGTSYFC